jgi:hypothetical protein
METPGSIGSARPYKNCKKKKKKRRIASAVDSD